MCKTAIGAMRPYCVYTRPLYPIKKKKKQNKIANSIVIDIWQEAKKVELFP